MKYKIKENIYLKELERFGFELNDTKTAYYWCDNKQRLWAVVYMNRKIMSQSNKGKAKVEELLSAGIAEVEK